MLYFALYLFNEFICIFKCQAQDFSLTAFEKFYHNFVTEINLIRSFYHKNNLNLEVLTKSSDSS